MVAPSAACAVEFSGRLTVPVASAIVAGPHRALSMPGKMPGFSWDLPAFTCKRGSILREIPGTVCWRCYGRRGHLIGRTVLTAQMSRLEGLEHPQWCEAMAYLIRQSDSVGYFRWFAIGDIQSVEHLAQICEVCERTPDTQHWLPTHEPFLVGEYLDSGGRIPDNLVVRISADYIESAHTTPTFGLNTSTVHRFPGEPVPIPALGSSRKASIECKAYTRRVQRRSGFIHNCGKCRACWERHVPNVSYLLH